MLDIQALQHSGRLFAHRYHIDRLLGRGGFSQVWLAYDETARINVALKIYIADGNALDEEGIAMFRKEFAMVCNMNHSNLLRPFTFDIEQGYPYLVLPYCERGSSTSLIGKLDETQLWEFIYDVCKGLEFLHSLNGGPIVHQDIKPANILISSQGNYVITDFGVSVGMRRSMRRSVNHIEEISGTIAYMGPERFGGNAHPIIANDIWSLGATLYELATGALPFGEQGGLNQKGGATIPPITEAYSNGLKHLIYSCMAIEPWERPSASQLVAACSTHSLPTHPKLSKNRFVKGSLVLIAGITVAGIAYFSTHSAISSGPKMNSQAISVLNEIDSILMVQNHAIENGANFLALNEEALARSANLIDSARTICHDVDLSARCDSLEQRVDDMATQAYEYFLQEEEYSNQIEAYERAKSFKKRKEKVKTILDQIAKTNKLNDYE